MHIVFGGVRQLVVDDHGQVVDIETACGDVGSDQYPQSAALEGFERVAALRLALVAMDRVGGDLVADQEVGQASAQQFGVDEDQGLGVGLVAQQLGEQVALEAAGNRMHPMGDGLGNHVAACDLDQLRVLEHLVGEALDLVREGGREQQALARGRQQFENALDVGNEPHVEHAVGFVQHQHLDLAQLYGLLLDVVEEAPRCRDDDLDSGTQFGDLGAHVDAAVDAGRSQGHVLAVGLDRLMNLHRQFARRCEDERPDRMAGRTGGGAGMGGEALEQRQRETGGLAGAGLGASHDIQAGENHRDGLHLDGGRLRVAGFGDRALQLGVQPEIGETHKSMSMKRPAMAPPRPGRALGLRERMGSGILGSARAVRLNVSKRGLYTGRLGRLVGCARDLCGSIRASCLSAVARGRP